MTVSELFGLNKEEKKETKKEEEKVTTTVKVETEEVKKEENNKVTKETPHEKVEEVKQKQNTENRINNNNNKQNRNNNNNNRNKNMQNGNFHNRNNNRNENRFNNNNNNNNNRFNNRNNNGYSKRPLDARGIEKNIKNIMSVENGEKEQVREYNRGLEKQKNNNRYEENKNNKKNSSKSRKNSNREFDEGKLKTLKQASSLSNMFNDQDGGMLDYYDLSTERGRRGKKKKQHQEEKSKQKIFKLTEIEIPETITVKDLAAEMKKTTAEVIKKLLSYGIMATINQEIDFDTAYLIAQEFEITAKKKKVVYLMILKIKKKI